MKIVYISGAIPEKMNNQQGASVAGNKFSLNLAQALDKQCGGELTFLSLGIPPRGNREIDDDIVWNQKRCIFVKRGKKFLISEMMQGWRIFKQIAKMRKEKPIILLENAACSPTAACVWLRRLFGIPIYSVLIDTPFTQAFVPNSLAGKIQYYRFRIGHKRLKHFTGLITFTRDVLKTLNINIPCHEFSIGCSQQQIDAASGSNSTKYPNAQSVAYAGTLIYYNGIQELVDAFKLLGDKYQLHIYGYGPLENVVKEAAAEFDNIVYYGRFDPSETTEILKQYPVLINPRRTDPSIQNFTFPSKLVDYLLMKRTVITNRFKTLPDAYASFVTTMEELSAEGIAKAVVQVFGTPIEERQNAAERGFEYVTQQQNYEKIGKDILQFVGGLV